MMIYNTNEGVEGQGRLKVALVIEHLGDGDGDVSCMASLRAGRGVLAVARREETEKPNPRASDGGKNNIKQDATILWCVQHRHVVQLHEILVTRKKVHFMLDLATSGELLSLMDSVENLKVADFGLGVVASSSDQHLRSRKLVNPRGIWN
jgi:hypothetical protein